jgi:hypothetical protein
VSENVKSLFGKGAEASDRVNGSREGMDVCRAIWDVPDKIGSGRPVRGMIAMAALELSREALT